MNGGRSSSSREPGRLSLVWPALLLVLSLAPLPLGSYRPWAWSLLAILVALLLCGWAASLLLGRRPLVWHWTLIVPVAAAGIVAGWIGFTTLPGAGSPNPIWQIASDAMGHALPGRIALSPDAALVGLMRLASYAALFWLSLQYCRESRHARLLLVCESWVGALYAVYGLGNYFSGGEHLLWYPRWASMNAVTSTFVNRNHYATFAGLSMLCATAMTTTTFRSAWQLSDRSQKRLTRTIECLVGWPLVYLVITLVIAMAWLQTHSRMGGVAVIAGMVAMFAGMMAAGLLRWRAVPLVAIALIGAFLLTVSGAGTIARLGLTSDIDRAPLFSVVADQIDSAPLTGSGYGSFPQAFLMYRDQRLPHAQNFPEAHNSYIELAAELGIPATLLLVGSLVWCAGLCLVAMFRRQRSQIYPIVALAATVIVGIHALADFSAQLPAIASFYAVLLGMGVAQSWSMDRLPARGARAAS